MKLLIVLTVAALAAPLAQAAHMERQSTDAVQTLRQHVVTNRLVTWKWQDKASLGRTSTTHIERRTHSRPFLRWLVHWWHRKAYQAMRAYHVQQRVVVTHGYAGLTSIPWADPYCESGGNPYNASNSTYRGKWQFDQGTWDKFAPPAWKGRDPATAPEYVQDQAALNVTYDAWPNC